jgi:hypothetical protein
MSLAMNAAGAVTSVSLFGYDSATGDLVYVDSMKLKGPPAPSFNSAWNDPTAVPKDGDAGAVYKSNQIESRTYMDDEGKPEMSVSLKGDDGAGYEIAGVTLFVNNAAGTVIFTDSMKLKDVDGTSPELDLPPFNAALMLEAADITFADVYESDLARADSFLSRTFMNAAGEPEMSVSINDLGEVSSVSYFTLGAGGDVLFTDSMNMQDQNSGDNLAVTLKAFDPNQNMDPLSGPVGTMTSAGAADVLATHATNAMITVSLPVLYGTGSPR